MHHADGHAGRNGRAGYSLTTDLACHATRPKPPSPYERGLSVIRGLWAVLTLREAGVALSFGPDGGLLAGPEKVLTPALRLLIVTWRAEILARLTREGKRP
jgi:hypothetical protein